MIGVSQCFQNFDFNFALFVQFLPVLQDLKSHYFFAFVIEAPNNHTKCTFSKLFLNFISVIDLLFGLVQVISLIIIESVIMNCVLVGIRIWILILTVNFTFDKLADALMFCVEIEVVNDVERGDFVPFVLGKALAINSQSIFRVHRKSGAAILGILFMLRILTN